jgi:hypothetical protein
MFIILSDSYVKQVPTNSFTLFHLKHHISRMSLTQASNFKTAISSL